MPGIRRSRGLYLEVLEPSALVDVPIEVDVFSGANPATMLVTLEGAFAKRFTRELSELGSGAFSLARTDPKATAAVLAIGNLVKFKVAGTYRHAVWIEEPATTVVSSGEEAGEDVAINGRGALAYLERATVYPPVWPPAPARVVGSSSADNGSTGTTSLTVPLPAGSAAGDVTIVSVLCVGAVPGTPPGWKRIRDVTEGTLRLALYVKRLLAYEPASTTWHWATATKASAASVSLRNASADDPGWAISDTTGSGTAVELPSVSVNLVDGVLVTLACSAANTSIAPGAGLTELVDRGATGRTVELAILENPALGDTGDLTATAGSSASWIGLQLEIPSTAAADAVFAGATFGSVLATLIDEAQRRGTVPVLTYDFTATADSHGEPWPDVHDLSFHVGTSLLEVWRHLVTLGLEGGMTPDLRLQAYVDASRHFESTVILRKGHHLVGDVVDTAHGSGLRTRLLVEGAGGRMIEVTDPAAEADARIGRREGYLSMSTSDNPTTLQRAGTTALASAAAEDAARSIAVVHGPASEGQFEPWVDYREGDWISLDADGSGGVAVPQRVASITLEETEAGDFGVELELNSVEMDAFLRLQRRLDALSRDTTASGSGGAVGGGGGAGGRVSASSSDTPGYLYDKLDVSGLTKQLAGDVGAQRVKLSGPAAGAAGGYAPLSSGLLVPAAYLGTSTPSSSKFLRGDGVWATPAGGGGGGAYPPGSPDALPSSPDAKDDEFDSGGLSAWSTFGTLDVSNATDVASHWHAKRTMSGQEIAGLLRAATPPFTVTCKMSDIWCVAGNGFAGLVLSDSAGTANFYTIGPVYASGYGGWNDLFRAHWSSLTVRRAQADSDGRSYAGVGLYPAFYPYIRLVVRSSTSYDLLASAKGRFWNTIVANETTTGYGNWTIAKAGIVIGGLGALTIEAYFDWIRFS